MCVCGVFANAWASGRRKKFQTDKIYRALAMYKPKLYNSNKMCIGCVEESLFFSFFWTKFHQIIIIIIISSLLPMLDSFSLG